MKTEIGWTAAGPFLERKEKAAVLPRYFSGRKSSVTISGTDISGRNDSRRWQ